MSWAAVGQVASSIIPGVGAFLGGRETAKATKHANEVNAGVARENLKFQKDMAMGGIQMKAMDARKAGLSPLAAMGAQVFSPSPVSAGAVPVDNGAGIASMGQSIGNALNHVSTAPQRASAQITTALTHERMKLENDLLRSQNLIALKTLNPPPPSVGRPIVSTSGLPAHIIGQGDSGKTGGALVEEVPLRRTHSNPGAPHSEVGHTADYGFAKTPQGLALVPSKDVKEKIEDQLIPELMWALRNQVMPNFGAGPTPPNPKDYPLPPGKTEWKWDHWTQQFRPSDGTGRSLKGARPKKNSKWHGSDSDLWR